MYIYIYWYSIGRIPSGPSALKASVDPLLHALGCQLLAVCEASCRSFTHMCLRGWGSEYRDYSRGGYRDYIRIHSPTPLSTTNFMHAELKQPRLSFMDLGFGVCGLLLTASYVVRQVRSSCESCWLRFLPGSSPRFEFI